MLISAFVRLIDLASVEARADNMQLCLSERALHAEHKAVVELGWIVTPSSSITSVPVMAQNSRRRCQSWFDRASREASREKIAPSWLMATSLTRDLKSSRLVVRAPLAEIPVEDPAIPPAGQTVPCSPDRTGGRCSPG